MSAPDPTPEGPREPELTPDEEKMNAWLDRQLPPADSQAFEDELARQPERKQEARTLASLVSQLRHLPSESAPRDLLADVQSDIRQRSRGRYFGYHWKYRFPYEALVNSLLLIGAVIVYVALRPAPPRLIPVEAKSFIAAGSELALGARILSDYGSFRRDPEVADKPEDPWIHLVGEVAGDRIEAFRTELSLYPSMRLDAEESVGAHVRVRVAIKR
jgi:hypothetical protein